MLVLIFEEKKIECCENNCYNEFSSDEDLTVTSRCICIMIIDRHVVKLGYNKHPLKRAVSFVSY